MTVTKCEYYGTVDTADEIKTSGGIVGHGGFFAETTITDCAFYGKVINTAATCNVGGIVGYTNSSGRFTMERCIVAGSFEKHNNSVTSRVTAFGVHNSDFSSYSDLYYLENVTKYIVMDGYQENFDRITATSVTDEQLASGEIAFLLGENWGQTVDGENKDAYPVLANGQNEVHKVKACDGVTDVYSNTNKNKSHTPSADDGDCTTAVKCAVCDQIAIEAKATHTVGADDGNCTTAVKCAECDKNAVEAKTAHEANADDGDCTTAVTCKHCPTVLTEAKTAHTDTNSDEKCDACGYGMPASNTDLETNPDNTPNSPDAPTDNKGGLGAGAIVAIVIGAIAVLGGGGFAIYWFVIRKKRR